MPLQNPYRKVIQFGQGKGMVVCLTPEIKQLGLSKGDLIYVRVNGSNIVLSSNEIGTLKPSALDEKTWRDLQAFVIQRHGNLDNLGKIFKEAIQKYLKESKSWRKKTILKIGD